MLIFRYQRRIRTLAQKMYHIRILIHYISTVEKSFSTFAPRSIVVGRGAECDLQVPAERTVAKRHFSLFFSGEGDRLWRMLALEKIYLFPEGKMVYPGEIVALEDENIVVAGMLPFHIFT